MESLNGVELTPGMKVWVDMPHMPEWFPGDVMYAEVVEGHREPQVGYVWVRQLATPALPLPKGMAAWVSEQHCIRCLAV